MKNRLFQYFKINDFNTSGDEIPDSVLIRIINNFATVLDEIREKWFDLPIYIRSCWRPTWYNTQEGGGTRSQHLFRGKSQGAVDISTEPEYNKCRRLPKAKDLRRLRDVLIKRTKFTRIVPYSSFIHADFGSNKKHGCERALYKVVAGKWVFVKSLD